MRQVKFLYDVHQKISINATGGFGVVDALLFDNNGEQYRVVYWQDDERRISWLYPWEISPERKFAKHS